MCTSSGSPGPTGSRGPRGHPEAILRPKAGERAFDVQRLAPRPELAEFVDYHWLVRWRVAEPFEQQVVPQPRVHVATEHGRLLVHGVTRRPFFRTLTGTGHALGAAFHAGGFRPLLKHTVGSVSDSVRAGLDVLHVDDRTAASRILGTDDPTTMVDALEEVPAGHRSGPGPGRPRGHRPGRAGRAPDRHHACRAARAARGRQPA
jgi:hypothetical protein